MYNYARIMYHGLGKVACPPQSPHHQDFLGALYLFKNIDIEDIKLQAISNQSTRRLHFKKHQTKVHQMIM